MSNGEDPLQRTNNRYSRTYTTVAQFGCCMTAEYSCDVGLQVQPDCSFHYLDLAKTPTKSSKDVFSQTSMKIKTAEKIGCLSKNCV
ncbi:hypothetical protein RN001_002397 [Aquatica leii]|uniref:Uncharacterized protein n=1 Tax=Aquatica leii TaxID=1421715 RepID=A0AAN7SD95_9COLE|nr:hypothetical protein RN001_002397 [Aquatica leii]